MGLNRQLSPFQLQKTFRFSSSSPEVLLEPQQMMNRGRTPMLVDAIRFSGSQLTDIMPFLEIRVRHELTNITTDYIPLWTLANVFNRSQSFNPLKEVSLGEAGSMPVVNSDLLWRFPEPIWVPMNGSFKVELRLAPSFYSLFLAFTPVESAVFNLTTTFEVRSLPQDEPLPAVLSVPYITSWRAGPFPPERRTIVRSTAIDLCNSEDHPLQIQRVVGRLSMSGTGDVYDDNYVTVPGNLEILTSLLTLNVQDADDQYLIPKNTPIMGVFSPEDNSWWCKALLAPKSYWIATVTADFRSIASGSLYPPDKAFLDIALMGNRRIRLK